MSYRAGVAGRQAAVVLAACLLLAACTTTVIGQAGTESGDGPAISGSTPTTTPSGEPPDQPVRGPLEGPIPRPAPGGEAAGRIPSGLEEFYEQQLTWQPCSGYNELADEARSYANPELQCANVIAPLSYDDPRGPTISLAIMRAVATGADPLGSIVINPGGPGWSGLSHLAGTVANGSASDVHEHFDLVSFDTRGVGGSRPKLSCQTNEEKDAARASNERTTTPAGVAAILASVEEYVEQCVSRTGADAGIDGAGFLVTMGTATTAKDLDLLRAVLGDEELTYLGYSYGTLLGTSYADQFTDEVRAMVLDGAVDPTQGVEEEAIAQAEAFQQAFEDFGAWCAAQRTCPIGNDPAAVTTEFQQLTRPLLDEPLPLPDGRVLTFSDALTGVGLAMYSDLLWETLRSGLIDLANGNGVVLMVLADQYIGRDSQGNYAGRLDALTAVRCMDYERLDASSTDTTLAEKVAAAAPFFDSGDPIVALPRTCDLWPGSPTLDLDPLTVDGLQPVVVISTTGDPATPYEAGVTLAEALDGALITVEGTRHTAFLGAGIPCVDEPTIEYLVTAEPPTDGLTCR